jgi:hypothetical protein
MQKESKKMKRPPKKQRFAPNTVEALRKTLTEHVTIAPSAVASTKTQVLEALSAEIRQLYAAGYKIPHISALFAAKGVAISETLLKKHQQTLARARREESKGETARESKEESIGESKATEAMRRVNTQTEQTVEGTPLRSSTKATVADTRKRASEFDVRPDNPDI